MILGRNIDVHKKIKSTGNKVLKVSKYLKYFFLLFYSLKDK